jgi:CheY-like chemotaxis protein
MISHHAILAAMLLPSAPPVSVLVVEGEWLLRVDLAEALEEVGCQVRMAISGEAALDLLQRCGALSVVVTDIRLGSGPIKSVAGRLGV